MKKLRSLFAIVLAVAIICSFTVISASAATTVDNEADFVTAIAAGGDIVLGDNITLTNALTISKDVTLDLNGKTLYVPGTFAGIEIYAGNVVINDSQGTGKIKSPAPIVVLASGGNLTINSGEYIPTSSSGNPLCVFGNIGKEVIVNGGTFTAQNDGCAISYYSTYPGSTFIINDCESSGGYPLRIAYEDVDTIALNGGHFTGSKAAFLLLNLTNNDATDANDVIGSGVTYYPSFDFPTKNGIGYYISSVKEIVIEKKTASIKDGADQTITDTSKGATITSDFDYCWFNDGTKQIGEVYVDDKIVDSNNYEASEGSTIIKFKPAYLETLSAGKHKVKIVSNVLGSKVAAETTLTIVDQKIVQTGDNNAIGAFAAIGVMSAAAFISLKKKEN